MGNDSLVAWWGCQAYYNRLANERLYEATAQVDDVARRAHRSGSFGSIHALLNHMLLADRIWLERFEGGGGYTPPLDTILYDHFPALCEARVAEDARIERFFASEAATRLAGATLLYVNSRGAHVELEANLAIGHFFNHATHHRGQVHVMIADAGGKPPALDMFLLLKT